MRKPFLTICLSLLAFFPLPSFAEKMPAKASASDPAIVKPSQLKLTVLNFDRLKAAQPNILKFKLTDANGRPVAPDDLKVVHTKKMHLLIVDKTLKDYFHLHPVADNEANIYTASFTPNTAGSYKAWLDVTPIAGHQQYLEFDLKGDAVCKVNCVARTLALDSEQGDIRAKLSFEKPLRAGEADLATVSFTDFKGTPIKNLEPVLGAFAHVVAFNENLSAPAHVHPMGQEPTNDSARAGPNLQFHFEPAEPGYLKIYVQIKRGGKDIYLPFGVNVAD